MAAFSSGASGVTLLVWRRALSARGAGRPGARGLLFATLGASRRPHAGGGHSASALSMAAFSSGASGVTLLGKNATTWPFLSITYFEKFQPGRFPVAPRY
jgi:hypothetical protein